MGLSASEVAAATHVKVQVIEDLEKEDYHRIAAPIYGKGFIRLYAEHVGLDPAPLIEDYMASRQSRPVPSLKARPPKPATDASEPRSLPVSAAAPPPPEAAEPDLFSSAPQTKKRSRSAGKRSRPKIGPRFRRSLDGLREKSVDTLITCLAAFSDGVRRVRSSGRFPSLGVGGFRFADAPARLVLLIVGLLVVAAFVVSGLSRFTRSQGPETVSRGPAPSEEVRLAIEPPEPYVD
jgi:hypothetical protein